MLYEVITLMMAIGFKGGVAIAQTAEFDFQIVATICAGLITGFTQPFLGYLLLKWTTKLDRATAAAVAGLDADAAAADRLRQSDA